VAHKEKTGSTRVPYYNKEDPQLGKWVCRQRSECTKQYRIDLLNKIGFFWNGREEAQKDPSVQVERAKLAHEAWMKMYNRLLAHKEKTGSVEAVWRKDARLARWVARQRNGCKTQKRIDLLNDIGFSWEKQPPDEVKEEVKQRAKQEAKQEVKQKS
jgi:hypothetical protein